MAEPPVTANLTTQQISALRKHDRQVLNLQRIKEANQKRYEEGCAELEVADPVPPERKPAFRIADNQSAFLTRDSFVKVEADTSCVRNRPHGYGYITACHGVGGAAIYDVKFTPAYDSGRIHKAISLSYLTSCSPFDDIIAEGKKQRRRQTQISTIPTPSQLVDDRLPIDKLRDALVVGSRQGKKTGWHRRTLGLQTGKQFNNKETQQFQIELILLEQLLSTSKVLVLSRYKKSGYFKKVKLPPVSLKYFVQIAWGFSNSFLCKFKKRMEKREVTVDESGVDMFVCPGNEEDSEGKPVETVVTNLQLAESYFTPQYMFALNECRLLAIDDPSSITTTEYWERHRTARQQYKDIDSDTKIIWESKTREYLHRQPQIAGLIINALQLNPKVSWLGLECAVDNWCSAKTIRTWLTSRHTFGYYAERIFPLLLPHQKLAHKAFATRFRCNWGLGPGKYLLIMFDEKWMWGLVMRCYSRKCDELGLNNKFFKAYHRNHINKVMLTAFTGFAFEDSIENGGRAVKLGVFRAQSFKVAEKMVRESVRQPDGSMKQTGPVKRKKGDLYLVDCAVTGTSEGTAKDPKCCLKMY